MSNLPQRINRQREEDYRREAWYRNVVFEHFRSEAAVRFGVEREKRQKCELGLLSCAVFEVGPVVRKYTSGCVGAYEMTRSGGNLCAASRG